MSATMPHQRRWWVGGSLASIPVIEDDDGTAEEVMTALGDHGYRLERACSGTDGLDRARARRR